jgi:hypothetical protein
MAKPLWAQDSTPAGSSGTADLVALLTFHTTNANKTYGAYGTVAGSRVNQRTFDALTVAAHVSGWGPLVITQGGLNGTTVSASAKTHVGLDVADVMCRGRSVDDIYRFVAVAMECGAIGFIRGSTKDKINDGMVPHIHFVMVGAQYAHTDARKQIYSPVYGYKNGGGGLGGAPWARWWGPKRLPLVEWADSTLNPRNAKP